MTGTPRSRGGGDDRRLGRDAGALDQAAGAVELGDPVVIQADFDAQLRDPSSAGRRTGVDADHLLAPRGEEARRRLPGAGQPDDEVRARRAAGVVASGAHA